MIISKFFKLLFRKHRKIHPQTLSFLCEQDGASERVLKKKLVELFQNEKNIITAYLVKSDLGKGQISIVLGLRTTCGFNQQILNNVGSIFANIFAKTEYLDILFLSETQENQLIEVCHPFFCRSET